jgi:hypothetical protein
MAYLKPDDDQDQQQQQQGTTPLAPGNNQTGGMVQGGMKGALGPPQQTPQQASGSGQFTNLKSWLDAGQGRDQNISTTGNTLLSGEKDIYNKAAQPLRSATFTPTQLSDDQIHNDLFSTTPEHASSDAPQPFVPGGGSGAGTGGSDLAPANGMDELKNWLNPTYNGPRSVNYDIAGNKNLHALDALSATSTAGAQLAGDTPYSAGARRLDNSVFGADAASQKAIADNKQGGTDFVKGATDEMTKLGQKVAGFDKVAADTAAKNKEKLKTIGDQIISGAQGKADADNAALQAAMDSKDSPWGMKQGGWVGSTPGSANVGNEITGSESNALQRLGQLIGGYDVQKSDPFQAGHREYVDDPWAVAQDPAEAFTPGTAANDTANSTSLVKTGQMGVYTDNAGNWVMKDSGLTIPKDALPAYMQWAAGKSSDEINAGLKDWLKGQGY